ncbi:MAG: tetratricopeptide repeat protein [Actinomycetota bacterium]
MTRLFFRVATLGACLALCKVGWGQEPGSGFLYAGKWSAPPPPRASTGYYWPSWSGPRSSYWQPPDDTAVPYNREQYERSRVDRRLHVPLTRAASGPLGLSFWGHSLLGAYRVNTDLVLGGAFVPRPTGKGQSANPFRYGTLSVPVSFYGAFDFTPTLWGGTCGADAPIAHAVLLATTPDRGRTDLPDLARFIQGEHDPLHQVTAVLDPAPERISRAVASLEHHLTGQREKGGGKHELIELGWFHQRYTRNRSKALWCFERAHRDLAVVPELRGAAAYHYGVALEDLGRRKEAEAVYRELVRELPEDFWVTDALLRLKGLGVSEQSLHLGLSPQGEAGTRQYLKAFAAGDYTAALRQARKVSTDHPGDPWSRLYEAYLLRLTSDDRRADACLEALRRKWPPYAEAAELLGYLLPQIEEERLAELPAVTRLKRQSRISLSEPLPYFLARVRDRAERFPADPLPWLLRAQATHLLSPNHPLDGRRIGLDSVEEFRHAVKLAPKSWAVRLYLFNHGDFYSPPSRHQLGPEEVSDHAEMLLRLNETGIWGIHALLAEVLYREEMLNRPQRATLHLKRYTALRKVRK